MSVSLFFSLLYLGVALQYAGDPSSTCTPPVPRRPPRVVSLVLACALFASAYGLWQQHEPGGAALLMTVAGLAGCGTWFVLMAPLLPRVCWGLASLALLAIPALLALGAWR